MESNTFFDNALHKVYTDLIEEHSKHIRLTQSLQFDNIPPSSPAPPFKISVS